MRSFYFFYSLIEKIALTYLSARRIIRDINAIGAIIPKEINNS